MRQKLCDLMVLLRRKTGQHILEIDIRIMPIEPGTLNQAHDGRRPLSRPERARKQPVVPVMCR